MTIRGLLLLALLAGLTPGLTGCGPLSFLVEKTFSMATPPAMSQPQYTLSSQSVAILVENALGGVEEEHPQVPYRVAQAVAQELSAHQAAGRIVNPYDVSLYAQNDPRFAGKSLVEIGRDLKVDIMLNLVVQNYVLVQATGADNYNGYAALGVRVIDVRAGAQVWPAMNQLYTLEAGSTMGITAASLPQAEKILLSGLARKVGMLFVAYNLEELPRDAQIR